MHYLTLAVRGFSYHYLVYSLIPTKRLKLLRLEHSLITLRDFISWEGKETYDLDACAGIAAAQPSCRLSGCLGAAYNQCAEFPLMGAEMLGGY